MPASNFPFAMLGVLLLWLGWIGFNGGSTLEMSDRVPGIVANTILAGCAGLVTALIFGWIRRGFPDPTLVINGSLAGLVSITASVFAVDAVSAVIIGSTGAIVMLVAEHVLLRLRIDDAIGAVPVDAAAGVWGTLAVAIFGAPEQLATGLNFWGQLLAQASGIVTCAAIAFGGTYLFAAAFKRVIPLRVSAEAEEAGLNVAEHRASTDSWDLLLAMHNQAVTADLTTRVPVEPFTEIGEIAASYNAVLSALEESDTRQKHAATHDSMTDLLNRTNFESAIETMIGDRRSSHGGVVFFLDLDQFKEVNDSMGHLAGDRLLKRVGDVLKDSLRATDVVGRVGGDEFAVFLPATGLDEARTVAEKVLATIRESALTVESQIVKTTTSIGVAEVRTRDTVGGLITRADLAMYHAKKNGGNRIAVYSEGEDWEEEVESRLRIQRLVSLAIKDDLLELHAQPILDLRTNMITRYELLVRLHDGHDLLTPETFVKIAERSGLIQSIDRWVVGKAIGLLSGNQSNRRHLRLAVNLSAKTLDDKELLLLVERQLSSTRIDATNLIFEVTETAAINDMGSAQGFLRRLKELGCQIALDDFGVGQSSLSNLKNLPVDVLKIDGSFIGNLAQDVTDQRLVWSIIDAARAVGAETVAEFVEDEATVECLRKIGVDYAQGYHIGRPGGVSKAFHEPKSKAA